MEISLLAQFWVVAVLLVLTPGADWAYLIAVATRARSATPALAGMLTGYALVGGVVAVGAGVVVTEHPLALTALTTAGSAYLIYLGVSTLLARVEAVAAGEQPTGARPASLYLRGLGISALNPKGLLLLMALLPQFTAPDGWPATAQMLVLGGLHVLDCALIYTGVALLARRLLGSRPTASVIITRVSGVVMTLIGAGILVESMVTW